MEREDQRVPGYGEDPSADDQRLTAADKGPSYTNIVSTIAISMCFSLA